ncbi:MAG TPA: hypothetical protein VEL06_01850 [Haliangiales bacterium]|nr:hypothetical protein [Haliangiales bacterium]
MSSQRQRPIVIAVAIITAAWVVAWAGYAIAKNSRMTADKVRAYARAVGLNQMSGDARAKAIRELAAKLNKLTPEERRKARVERVPQTWFEAMTEEEKGTFIELTMPTGFKQMLASFEQLPEERRRRAIGDALRRLKEEQEKMKEDGEAPSEATTNAPPVLSKDLQEKVTKIGLKTFYSESSAQTKAEMAPLLEELQRTMESGRMFRGGR